MNTVKKHAQHGFSQFQLTTEIVKNLSQFDITPTAKLVLIYLTTCYNPKKAEVFPKQKTIAAKTGISERSVVRAVQELFKAGLILIECKTTNHYKIVAKWGSYKPENEKNFNTDILSDNSGQIVTSQNDKLSPAIYEQKKEQKKEPEKVEDFKILKNYAESKGAKNVTAYINALKNNGSADKIIKDFKGKQSADRYYKRLGEETIKRNAEMKKWVGVDPKTIPSVQEFLKKYEKELKRK